MIRPFTCVCMILAAGSGLYLYQTKHRAQLLDREIQRVIDQTETVRKRSGMLRGEYALLSEPDRLTELSKQHLALKPLAPTQFLAMADLGGRLPAPLPASSFLPPPDETPEVPAAPVPVKAGAAASAPAQVAAAPVRAAAPAVPAVTSPQVAAAKPVQVAALPTPAAPPAAPTPSAPAPGAATRTAKPAARPAEPAPIARTSAPIVAVSATPFAMGRPAGGNVIGESVARVSRGLPPLPYNADGAAVTRVAAAPITTAQMTPLASVPVASVPVASMLGGSVLGGVRTALPAPVPYGTAR